ncbi:MAG TPA: site-specific integrase [Nitrobacter sp.]|uniref:tyrosine-type recombinase/integrase n=1 Tax=Nitrobacter sp. TaxID=29420 RepID=UPI002BC7B072|nr:site-specific integrase [Nitrobacter sp.]
MPKLTKTEVEKAPPREKQYTLWCSELRGFGVYIHPTGRRTYFVDYRTGDGARRRMTIGRHGAITTDQARKLAIETMGGIVLQKGDPLLERKTRRSSLTIAELCDQYVAAVERGLIIGRAGQPKRSTTLSTDRGRIVRHIKPLLGKRLVIDLDRSEVIRFMRDVHSGKTAVRNRSGKNGARVMVTGGPGTAARTTGLLGGILTYAVDEGIIENNPARGVKRPADRQRDRRLTRDEYRRLGEALTGELAELDARQAVTGVWLLALTGCRLGEIVMLRWSEVDAASGCLRLTDSKTGPSTRPAGHAAFDILNDALRVDGNPYVLPAMRGALYYRGLAGYITRLMKRAELEGVTAHTLRHSFASVAGDLGYSDSTIGAVLGHSSSTMTSRYVHRLDTVLVAAANKIAGEVWRQMTGESGKVVNIRGG